MDEKEWMPHHIVCLEEEAAKQLPQLRADALRLYGARLMYYGGFKHKPGQPNVLVGDVVMLRADQIIEMKIGIDTAEFLDQEFKHDPVMFAMLPVIVGNRCMIRVQQFAQKRTEDLA